MTPEERWEQHIERLHRAIGHIDQLVKNTVNARELTRLQGKRDGLKVALSYAYEADR